MQDASIMTILLNHVLDICGVVVTTLLVELIRRGIVYFTKKTKIEVPAKLEALLIDIAEHSVNFANEKAHQFTKIHGSKMHSGEKLTAALTFANHLVEEHKLKDIAEEKLTRYIESRLGAKR